MAVRDLPAVSTLRGRALDRDLLLRASVPATDVCVLAAAIVIVGLTPWSVAYACLVLLGLHLDPARSGRICPRLSPRCV